jgi:tyrosinase
MSNTERKRFIDTYKFASQNAPYKAQFDAIVLAHGVLFGSGIHNNGRFFPWHRYYLLKLENLLQQIDCRVTIPYWDWALEATSPMTSVIWSDAPHWLGGDGNGGCVPNGPFGPGWLQANGNCLTRDFNFAATTATKPTIAGHIAANPLASDYDTFRNLIEHGPGLHDSVHCIILGTMCSGDAALAPEFFLHHANIDKIWADWQKADPTHVLAYGPGSAVAPMPGTPTRPIDVLDLNAQVMDAIEPPVRVCYVEPTNWGWLDVAVSVIGVQQLTLLPRVFTSPANPTWWELMKMSAADIERFRAMEAEANDPRVWTLVDQKEALGNCSLMASGGVYYPDDYLNRLAKELTEQGPQIESF